MNRADRLKAEGEGSRGAIVGFALTTLQRRLASSPEAIYQSLARRRRRLEKRLSEEQIRRRGSELAAWRARGDFRGFDDDFDLDDLPEGELEELEEQLVDEASAARTIADLKHEIATLADLEELARQLRDSDADRKWDELSRLVQDKPEMYDAYGSRRKLIVFSEHRDTLNYLVRKLQALLGRQDAVVSIHGGMPREQRRKIQEAFIHDKEVLILVATDAAGEGINLQRAHLMVNYDLPWNPNRIEQRFGRVHRIGQTEVCHLWNLVAEDTREGQVFGRLFEKLNEQRRALGDQVFDVLGDAFRGQSLRDLLIKAVRYGEQPDVKQRLREVVDATVGDALRQVVHDRALVSDVMTTGDVERIREEMERAEARKLQPHFIRSFFLTAFAHLGGVVREREPGRFEVSNVPAELRHRDRQIGRGAPLLRRYERVTFEKDLIAAGRGPAAEYITPGHPLLDGTIDLIAERYGSLLRQGAVLIDEHDPGLVPHVLVYLEHSVVDGRADRAGDRRVVSRRFEFVSVDPEGAGRAAGWAPYLDLRHASPEEITFLAPVIDGGWILSDLEDAAVGYGIQLARAHLEEVRRRTVDRVERTTAAVRARLESEIRHWDHRANQLRERELAGRLPRSGMNSANARQRADELQGRLRQRLEALDAQRQLSSLPPVVAGAALVVPAGLLSSQRGVPAGDVAEQARARSAVERAALNAVLAIERALGHNPVEMPPNNKGYDIESKAPDGSLLFVEVKGRTRGAETFTVTRSEIGVGRNMPGQHILALAEVPAAGSPDVRYIHGAFRDISDLPFDAISVNLPWGSYFDRGEVPA
jgi:hypothetical protein